MGQDEILKLLKKEKKWMTQKEIVLKLNIGGNCANTSLRKLVKYNEVKRKEEIGEKNRRIHYLYKFKKTQIL